MKSSDTRKRSIYYNYFGIYKIIKNVAAFEHVNAFLSQAAFVDSSRLICERWIKLWILKEGKRSQVGIRVLCAQAFYVKLHTCLCLA